LGRGSELREHLLAILGRGDGYRSGAVGEAVVGVVREDEVDDVGADLFRVPG